MYFKFLTPKNIVNFAEQYRIYSFLLFIPILLISLYYAFLASPIDYQQGNSVRIMYIHVPSAWLALLIYSAIAILSIFSFIYQNPLLSLSAIALAPIGMIFALITLVTGSIWGKPMWGTWWVFDPRLTSTLLLLFLYLGYIALYNAYDNFILASKFASILAIIGFINIPIVKFSVEIWNSLHQPASIIRKGGIAIDGEMLKPLFLMFISLILYCLHIFLTRLKSLIISKKLNR